MKILITGGTTFVSKYAAEYFVSKDNDVTVINRGSRPQVNGVAHISCDRTALGDSLNGKHFDLMKSISKRCMIRALALIITFSSAPVLSIPRAIRSRLPRNSPAVTILFGAITE